MKKIVAIFLCICCFIPTLTSCQGILNKKEQNFINYYNSYAKDIIENPETVVIKTISESADANGGTLVHFSYEYTTAVGYKTSRSMYMVTSKITVDASLITLSEWNEFLYGDAVVALNGKSVDVGFVSENIHSHSQDEDVKIVYLWHHLQSDDSYSNNDDYDLKIINTYLNKK